MDGPKFQEYKPNSSRYNGRISEDEWNKHKPKLQELHNRKYTRQQILDIVSQDFEDTKPTYGQLCTKFDKWGFHVYRQPKDGNAKDNNTSGRPKKSKNVAKVEAEKLQESVQTELNIQQPFSPESSNGSFLYDVGRLDLNDNSTPRTINDFQTPRAQYSEPSVWSDITPRANNHSRDPSDQNSTPPLGSIYEHESAYHNDGSRFQEPYEQHGQHWLQSDSTLSHGGQRSSMSGTPSSRDSLYQTTTEATTVEPDDPPVIATRTKKADEALDSVNLYLRSIGQDSATGGHTISMVSLAAYLFATRSYSAAFQMYHRIYDLMLQDMQSDNISKLGALMRCFQSAVEPQDLDFMQNELHHVLQWNLNDSSLSAFTAQMLQSVEMQIEQGFNLTQGSVLLTSSITRNLNYLATKGCTSTYPGTRRLYWRLRLLKHSPFHSGCKRLLRLMSELLSWAWAAMAVLKFPDPALQSTGCLCKDGLYFDFVRMVTTVILEAAMGFEIAQLIKVPNLKQTPCDCVMCADLESTFELCPIETFTAIALLTVDRCRLDWTSCHPGGRHQELSPNSILHQQLQPTIESLLDQVAADIRSTTTIHTSDLYDDFLSCVWSCFETHDLPLRNARFDASSAKVEDIMTTLITEEMDKSHPARQSTHGNDNGKMPVFSYGENDELANKITAKRTRSNASSLKPSASNASERSMIRIRKKLKFRTSADYLNSMSSYSSLSSRNSVNNRFSYVTGLPELETVMDDEELQALPPDLTPDEFRTMQRHDSWTRRSDHFSWVPSRPGSTASRGMSWRESNGNNIAASTSRPGSVQQSNSMNRKPSQKDSATPHGQALRNSMAQQQQQSQPYIQNQQSYYQNQQPIQTEVPQQVSYQRPNQQSQAPQPQRQRTIAPPTPTQHPAITALPQAVGSSHQLHISNHNNSKSANNSSTSIQSHSSSSQHQVANPQRRDSTKTTRSKESHKGRWSSERDRIENALRAMP